MVVEPGVRLGPYELVSRIGAGGMGEVWQARDTRLGRSVAVKILPADFARDPQSRTRFEREAETISQLEHPNICRLYDVGEVPAADGPPVSYLVMELLAGETLAVKLRSHPQSQAPLPLRKALEYAAQLGEGLAAAHERGIVHRDLKPENLFITREGRLKILDFGLAKQSASVNPGASVETMRRDTSPGVVLGTAAYMSPEQVRAEPVDHRSDLFAVGIILSEMVTGHHPFRGRSSIETMNAILTADPPALDRSAGVVSPGLDSIIRRLLEKDPHERFQSARDLTFALEAVSMPSGAAPAAAARRSRAASRTAAIAAATVLGLVAGAGVVSLFMRPTPAASVSVVRRLTFESGVEQYPALSPDGKTFLFVSSSGGNADIYLQRVDGRNAINLTSDSPASDLQPVFSPDGARIAFRSSRDGGGLFVMGATGETVRRLTTFGYNPSWSPDGSRIVFSTEQVALNPRGRTPPAALWTVDVRSGATKQLTRRDAVQPSWSPHGTRIAFWGLPSGGGQRDVWTIDPDAADPDTTAVAATDDPSLDWNPVWAKDGSALYFGSDRGGSMNLWRLRLDEKTGRTSGAPEPVTLPTPFAAHFSASRDADALIFASVLSTNAIERYTLDDLVPQPVAIFTGSLGITAFDVSPDGNQIVLSATTGAQEDLFLMKSDGSRIQQLTNDAESDRGPVWSADGTRIYFYSSRGDRYEVYSVRPDGGQLTQITHSPGQLINIPRPSPDGTRLVLANDKGSMLWNLETSRYEELALPDPKHTISDARWSPDGGRLLALESPAGNLNSTSGIVIYDFAAKTYRRVGDDPAYGLAWLNNQAFASVTTAGMTVHDLATGKRREIKLARVPAGPRSIAASPDGRFVYVRTARTDGDLFLATLPPH